MSVKVIVEEAGDGIPVKFITLIIRKGVLAAHDYGTYTCVAKGDGSQAQASTKIRHIGNHFQLMEWRHILNKLLLI